MGDRKKKKADDGDGARARDAAAGPAGRDATTTAKSSELSRKDYEAKLEPLEVELDRLARWIQKTGHRLLVIFEGRDTAGKGGAIQAVADRLNPRQCRVVALGKPSEAEAGQWYFQRFTQHLPGRGQITLFDRSWYNRAGVERVMGYATPSQVEAFLGTVPSSRRCWSTTASSCSNIG